MNKLQELLIKIKASIIYAYDQFNNFIDPIFPKDSATRSIVKFAISYILVATILTERLAHVLAFSWLIYCVKTKR
jgi:hypothetical protein